MIFLKTPFCKILIQNVLIIPLNYFFFQTSSGHKSVKGLFDRFLVQIFVSTMNLQSRRLCEPRLTSDCFALLFARLPVAIASKRRTHEVQSAKDLQCIGPLIRGITIFLSRVSIRKICVCERKCECLGTKLWTLCSKDADSA